ncbi:peptide chain release factor 2 [Helicobacter sp. MIT 14-3879]|uniref:peptide chain release factor 2 n=1 Tax=Helicobacter sp. MIT 14-3879 TaxID=2040649 RepID=UPI000E1E50FE|nr:peptide chain release factor 2 [Helicobacter sp. MIT 14-3879]RDU65021.1 peptide chain release factor 2 [Helicobacter sp. MIT 14-3879]
MDSYEYGELLKNLKIKAQNIAKIIKIDELQKELDSIIDLEKDESFWMDTKKIANIGKKKSKINRILEIYKQANKAINDADELYNLAISEEDNEILESLFSEAEDLENSIKKIEIEVMLSDKNDSLNAIVTIQPGAGGTESQDWGSILYRMYLRWCERRGFKIELLDYQDGEEAGIKGVAFIIKGENAYGYAKSENGIHRLVRISPFDANAKRHTSFASVQVTPEIDDDIDIVIEDKDIRIDTYRASGAGGQHINKTESAIRITHIPTGIVVQCQNDRSQHKNKATAFKMLKSRLYDLELKKQNNIIDEKSEIGWGHQIRSYVLAPYQQVKDLRSNIAYSNVDSILDGDIDSIIEGVLIAEGSKE